MAFAASLLYDCFAYSFKSATPKRLKLIKTIAMKKIFTFCLLVGTILHYQAFSQTSTACNANFSFTISGNTVTFIPAANADSSSVHHTWKFGDGNAVQNVYEPTHTYATPGTYIVTQYIVKYVSTVTGIVCSDSLQQTIIIPSANPNCGIYAAYQFARDSIQSNTIHFTNISKSYNAINYVRWYFGDSTYSTVYSPSHTFTRSGLYHVCLLIKNDSLSSCSSDTCMYIQIEVPVVCNIQAYFNSTVDSLHSNIIHFNNYTTNLATTDSAYWDFGDGTTSRDANPIHTYAQGGTYNACLTISRITTPGTAPCISKFCRTITVTTPCDFAIGYSYKLDSANHYKVYFTATNIITNGSVKWSYGDNSPLDSTWTTAHTFANAGKYNVCIRVQTSANCVKYQCDTIVIAAPVPVCNIQAYFNSTVDSLHYNLIHFHNYTTNLATTDSAYWVFGDSTTSRDINPNHTYAQAGTYNACLTVTRVTVPGIAPCISKYCRTITVTNPCDFAIGYSYKLDSTNHNKVYFTAANIITNGSVKWSYGDNSPLDSTWTTSHLFAQSGKYNVCIRVQTNANCVKYYCDTIVIPVPIVACNLKAGFMDTRDSLAIDINTYQFTNTSTPTTGYDSSYWNFGDGSPVSRDKNPTHVFATSGNYTVCLYVRNTIASSNATGCVSNICQTIVVPNVCNIEPDYTSKIDSLNSTVYFTNTTAPASSTATAIWFFGDGSSSTLWNATHVYAQPGRYYVCLRIQSSTTCIKYKCDSITIPTPVPVPACNSLSLFTTIQSTAINQYTFTPVYISTPIQYTWTFGDGTGSKNVISNHLYTTAGNYTACLTAYHDSTCASTTCHQVEVKPIINCDTIALSYSSTQDGSTANKVYFNANINYPIQQESWTISNLNSTAILATINQTNPYYIFSDTGYYRVCVSVTTTNSCTVEYCNIIHVAAITSACELQAYPNPVQTQVSVNVPLSTAELIRANLYNEQGALLSQTEQQGSTGINIITISTGNLVAGVYSIQLVYGNNICYSKFQKL